MDIDISINKSPNAKKSAYIVTKPLQYINATNIDDDLQKDCFIVDLFSGAGQFCHVIKKYSNHWNSVEKYKSRYHAIFRIILRKKQYKNLFIDSDNGIILTFFLLMLSGVDIYTYEEGFGSYRFIRNNNTLFNKFKSVIYSLLGCNNWIGGNICTRGVYLYYPEAFKQLIDYKKEIFKFKNDYLHHLKGLNEINQFYGSFNTAQFKNKKVVVYLSNWKVNPKISLHLQNYPGYLKIFKPHPHIKGNGINITGFDVVIENFIPAELLLTNLVNVCDEVVVIHENSSALIYIAPYNIKSVNISESAIITDYKKIMDTILNYVPEKDASKQELELIDQFLDGEQKN